MNSYHTTIDNLIREYKNDITLFMNSNQKLNELMSEIDDLINSRKPSFLDYLYFKKSYISLFFPFQTYTNFSYTPYIGGLLLGNSSNCKFTIATVNINGNQFKLFSKIVDYSEQNKFGVQDLLIFDILSAIIFDYILSLNDYLQYKDSIAKYRGSFLSYTRKDNKKDFWNFNDLSNHRNTKSLYNPYSFQMVERNKKVIVATYDAIDNPITITEIFEKFETDNDPEIIENVMANCCDIYNFLRDIGLNFGFMHNDLHMSNLLYNPATRKIMVIDFGRASFAKFMVDDINDIDKKIIVDFEKLNYNQTFQIDLSSITKKGGNSNTETYESAQETFFETQIEKAEDLFINFLYKNKDFFRKKYSPIAINGKYFGIIFDLITYSLNIYIRLLFFMKKTYTDNDFDEFYNNFKKIIEIDFYGNIANLLNNNVTIITNYSNENELLSNYEKIKRDYIAKLNEGTQEKRIYTMLLEGLFYTGLLILFNRRIKRNGYIYKYFQVLNTVDELEQFKIFVIEFINRDTNYQILLSDSFLSNFITIRTGGLLMNSSNKLENPVIDKNSRLSLPLTLPLSLPLKMINIDETVNAYIEIYKDYDKYRAPNDCDCFSTKKGGYNKRILKKYNYNR